MDAHVEETQKLKSAITEQTRSMEVLERNMQTVSREITSIVGKIEEAGMDSCLIRSGDAEMPFPNKVAASFAGAERADNMRACHGQQSRARPVELGLLSRCWTLFGYNLYHGAYYVGGTKMGP